MNSAPLTNWNPFDNILYIGDEARACLRIIEKFNNKLLEIEQVYISWFERRHAKNRLGGHDKLQHHIHYHFEGGIAVFKFRSEDDLPDYIRDECFAACKYLTGQEL
ncbi:MAG TPA: hypothetical protein VHA56_22635 [Mucilaginibacter sp.]|nr:hypothetical protein [Mucilaginibacter sp.]